MDKITDKDLIEFIKSSTSWNEVINKCGLKIRTRNFERRIKKINNEFTQHLPTFYGGLYSKIGKYTDSFYKELIKKYDNWDDVLEELGFSSLQCMKKLKIHLEKINIDYSKLSYPKKIKYHKSIDLKEILVEDSMYSYMNGLKKKLINEIGWKWECSGCNKTTYSNNWVFNVPIPLEIDHINGNHSDNRIENLRFLCPNCHYFTETYKGRNMRIAIINRNKKEDSNEIIVDILESIIKNVENKIKEKNKCLCIDCNKIEVSRYGKRCIKCNNINKFNNKELRVVKDRPSLEKIESELNELGGYCAVARKYGVSDNCIRKWIKKYKRDLEIL
jgi:Zn finger protein HypA/HybF involved in hydrogenase expression